VSSLLRSRPTVSRSKGKKELIENKASTKKKKTRETEQAPRSACANGSLPETPERKRDGGIPTAKHRARRRKIRTREKTTTLNRLPGRDGGRRGDVIVTTLGLNPLCELRK
jgi:hypothetical protein